VIDKHLLGVLQCFIDGNDTHDGKDRRKSGVKHDAIDHQKNQVFKKGGHREMKTTKLLMIMAAVVIAFGLSGTAMAFHDGGVAHCDGCHTMHQSLDGTTMTQQGHSGTPNPDLTIGSDPTGTCLNCHDGAGSYHINSADGSNFTPGGDFYWMGKTFTWTAHNTAYESAGDDHGHNVITSDFPGFTEDGTLGTAPGGTYDAGDLGCTSCHDPHGKVYNGGVAAPIEGSGSYGDTATVPGAIMGNFRLLGDVNYDAGPTTTFSEPAPVAVTASFFGPGRNETDTSHTDYGQGMSEWCAQCHGNFTGANRHVVGAAATLEGDMVGQYEDYVATGNLDGDPLTSYWALVPFERGENATVATLSASSTSGPDTESNVMCLTCHRAHASAFQNAGRWDFTAEFIADSHPSSGNGLDPADEDYVPPDGGVTGNDILYSYYNRDKTTEWGPLQRSLCNKCHGRD
jgi:hypothetical protein